MAAASSGCKPTEVKRDYTAPYMTLADADAHGAAAGRATWCCRDNDEAVHNLLAHGLAVERLEGVHGQRGAFRVEKVETAKSLYQGHVAVTLDRPLRDRPKWSCRLARAFVDMRQPLARLVPVLLEPASGDSLAAWGFFNRALVRQWSTEPGVYPVLRVAARPPAPLLLRETY